MLAGGLAVVTHWNCECTGWTRWRGGSWTAILINSCTRRSAGTFVFAVDHSIVIGIVQPGI